MKKIFCYLVVISIIISLFSVRAVATQDEISFEEFSSKLTEMVLKYEGTSLSSSTIEKEPLRLIVKTEKNEKLKDYYDAVCVIEGYKGLHILQYLTEEQLEFAYKAFSFDDIEYVDKDFYVDLSGYQTQPLDSDTEFWSWNSAATAVDKSFELISNSDINLSEVTVAVLDSGIYAKHEKFLNSGRIIDSLHIYEQTVVDDEGKKVTISYSSMDDLYYHGTHVSGVLFNNSMSNVKIKPYKITNSSKVLYSILCETMTDIVEKHIACDDNHIDILNMSIAGDNDDSDYGWLYDTIDYVVDNGIVVVVAAGNDSMLTDGIYPACNPKAITVAATNQENVPAFFSNFGDAVDISAPGTDIYSTMPRLLTDEDLYAPSRSEYAYDSGTSMAAPLVSAAAALIKSIDPDITPAEVERIIKETAYVPDDWEESCGGKNYGTGIVNFYNIAKAMLGEKSSTPVISKTTDNKFEISLPDGIEGDIFYTLDGSQPTTVNGLLYSEPIDLSDKNVNELKAVCHESGKVCGDTAVKDLVMRKSLKLDYKETYMTMPYEYAYKGLWLDTDKNIADSNYKGEITGKSPGTSNVVFKLPNGERIIYTVTVDYALWQEIIIYFFFGFLWYI